MAEEDGSAASDEGSGGSGGDAKPRSLTLKEATTRLGEYEAALVHYMGEGFQELLDEHILARRDGTLVFVPPAAAEEGDSGAESNDDSAAAAEGAQEGEGDEGAARATVTSLPAAFAGRREREGKYTPARAAKLSPAEFVKNREAIYKEAAANG